MANFNITLSTVEGYLVLNGLTIARDRECQKAYRAMQHEDWNQMALHVEAAKQYTTLRDRIQHNADMV